jgi:putative DNA primase/helicase
LSQVLQLKRPANYSPGEGCRFEVHLTKARGVYGEAATPFEAQFQTDSRGQGTWSCRPLATARKDRILELARTGATTQRAIAQALGISPATVNRNIQELRAEGRWPEAVS